MAGSLDFFFFFVNFLFTDKYVKVAPRDLSDTFRQEIPTFHFHVTHDSMYNLYNP